MFVAKSIRKLELRKRIKVLHTLAHFRFGSEADIEAPSPDVRFTPESGDQSDIAACPLCAKSGYGRGWRAGCRRAEILVDPLTPSKENAASLTAVV